MKNSTKNLINIFAGVVAAWLFWAFVGFTILRLTDTCYIACLTSVTFVYLLIRLWNNYHNKDKQDG